MKYDVDYFIKFFSEIPEEKWCTNRLIAGTQACALGHCYLSSRDGRNENILGELISVFNNVGIGKLNDGSNPNYQQPTPKQRILAALNDIKRCGVPIPQTPKHIDITAELAVLPVEETIDNPKIKEYVDL